MIVIAPEEKMPVGFDGVNIEGGGRGGPADLDREFGDCSDGVVFVEIG